MLGISIPQVQVVEAQAISDNIRKIVYQEAGIEIISFPPNLVFIKCKKA